MRRLIWLGSACVLAAVWTGACEGPQGPQGVPGLPGEPGPGATGGSTDAGLFGAQYAGSASCQRCHQQISAAFFQSGHAYKLNPVDGGSPAYPQGDGGTRVLPDSALPAGYGWSDISYVIGGFNWKARYLNQQGYIITDLPNASTPDASYLNQYNLPNPLIGFPDGGMVKYKSGTPNVKYDCGPCHTTGYVPTGNHEGRPGIVGTWAEPGIRCEACHGPGSLHAANPYGVRMRVDRDPEACGQCHRRGDVTQVDAKDGFIEHHEQYEELFQSKHLAIKCVDCHDPHLGVVQLRRQRPDAVATRTPCEGCHFRQAQNQKSAVHPSVGVRCIDCHMPRIIKNALGDASAYTGDIRTHMVAIDPNQLGQFVDGGSASLSQVSLDFACRHCHRAGGRATPKTDAVLRTTASGYHSPAAGP